MILDSSAIIATIANEHDSSRYRAAMRGAENLAVLETRIVLLIRFGMEAVALFDELLEKAGIDVVPFDAEMSKAAFDAFRRFGKGRGILPNRTWLIARRARWRMRDPSRYCSKERILPGRISSPRLDNLSIC